MKINFNRLLVACSLILNVFLTSNSYSASIVILNSDGVDEGLNDTTPVLPFDGNPGKTIGEQRLYVLQFAADFLESVLDFNVDIKSDVRFDPDEPYILGSASPVSFEYQAVPTDLPQANTIYAQSIANQFFGYDRREFDSDITININSDFNSYLGLNSQSSDPNQAHLLGIMLHEIIHGLGFLETTNYDGSFYYFYPDIFSNFLEDHGSSLTWNLMNDQQRSLSITSNNLHWVGNNTRSQSELIQDFFNGLGLISGHWPDGDISMYAPNINSPGSSGSHFDVILKPDEIMEHAQNYEDPKNHIGLAKQVLQDIGWSLHANGDKPVLSFLADEEIMINSEVNKVFAIYDNDNDLHLEESLGLSNSSVTPNLKISFNATSSNQAVVENSGLNISGVLNNESITSETLRELSIIPVSNAEGETLISVTVTDPDGNTDTQSFNLLVFNPNKPTTVLGDIIGSTPSGGILSGQLFATDEDGLTDGEYFSVFNNPSGGQVVVNSENGIWLYISNPDFSGPDMFTIRITDDKGFFHDQEIQVFVSSSNDEDGDGVENQLDAFPFDFNEQSDFDKDGVGDNTDNCFSVVNPFQNNFDLDSYGDACDLDIDNDGILNTTEERFGGNNKDGSDTDIVLQRMQQFISSTPIDTDNDGISDELEQIIGNGVSDVTHGSILLRMKEILFSKPVPTMGGIGLLALGLSMLGLGAVRLRKK